MLADQPLHVRVRARRHEGAAPFRQSSIRHSETNWQQCNINYSDTFCIFHRNCYLLLSASIRSNYWIYSHKTPKGNHRWWITILALSVDEWMTMTADELTYCGVLAVQPLGKAQIQLQLLSDDCIGLPRQCLRGTVNKSSRCVRRCSTSKSYDPRYGIQSEV